MKESGKEKKNISNFLIASSYNTVMGMCPVENHFESQNYHQDRECSGRLE